MVHQNEFQAVVLAGGKGSRMTELTAGKPKCLLPIANMPMIWYPLKLLEQSNFAETIVIVSDAVKVDVVAAIDKLNLTIKTDVIGIPDAEDIGTADSIRFIHDKIHSDFVVISSDLIANIDISETLNLYRKHNASITALILQTPKTPEDFVQPGPKSKQKPERDLIGIDRETGRIVFLASASDFEETINMPNKLLKKHSDFIVHSKLLDAHLYVINKWVLNFLIHRKNFNTLKGELLPYIVKKQLDKPNTSMDDKNASVVKMDIKKDIFQFAVEKPLDNLIRNMSAFNDHITDMDDAYHGDIIRCYAHIINGKCGLRANTLQMYSLANAIVDKWFDLKKDEVSLSNISPTATVKSSQVQNCIIDENSLISEKTSLKQSYISNNVIVNPKTRISKSIIMSNVTIKERCVIENCIICNDCTIEEETELKDCLVGANHIVPPGSHHTREVLTDIDRLMEI
ncbi:PREDICTED: translation initiation factor eIF-2B subunit gamma isoform X2 [Ceratosolen solmsi marchali]|nr:PREDICTED: translation initiation factor eIF-2B subunit gamma isoform X2 [Ceratosolen solmsi marchali]XP_011495859.1 PREDICTED: translation initiation factor eIF-2B subunit gamma isoform X2 [Ceratosolen solmsi marchali]XP_011495860.1 PREDICTED: translation initiation factor eIF-2B subunit gamma isoform X2 [Ceratosolen solmsi marchali]